MEEIGALLARYHATAEQIRMPGQRPSTLPLAEVPDVLLSALDSAGVAGHHSTVIRQHAEQLSRHLSEIAPMDRELAVIHGDFTNDNVIASGNPPTATSVIDFALAHIEHPLADIGYALWRSGRPAQHATCLDLGRVSRYVRGAGAWRPGPCRQLASAGRLLWGGDHRRTALWKTSVSACSFALIHSTSGSMPMSGRRPRTRLAIICRPRPMR